MFITGTIAKRYVRGVLRTKMNGLVQIVIRKSNIVCDKLLLLQCAYH